MKGTPSSRAFGETNVYVDGFNLYYRCLKGTPFKWLDLAGVCRILLPGHDIKRIRYFTAVVESREDPQQQQRQQTYLRALQTIPNLTIHYGQFRTHAVRLPLAWPLPGDPRTVEVLKTEEKGSDVNLATLMLLDACRGDCGVAVVVSNDSDLKGPIAAVRSELGRSVGVVVPAGVLRSVLPADFHKPLRRWVLAASQFPAVMRDGSGEFAKPLGW